MRAEELTPADRELVEAARRTVDENSDGGTQAPCGRDRQVLADLHPGISVILPTPEGVRRVPVGDLLPFAYVAPDE